MVSHTSPSQRYWSACGKLRKCGRPRTFRYGDAAIALIYFIAGCFLGATYLYFDSIIIPIMLHQTVNMLEVGYHAPLGFPLNLIGIIPFLAPLAVAVATVRAFAYETYLKKPSPTEKLRR